MLDNAINTNVKCTICGTKGVGNCDCWSKCRKCGWSYETGETCGHCENPDEPPTIAASGTLKI